MNQFLRIESAANPRIKTAIRLRDSRVRRRENLFLIDGVREIVRAKQGGIILRELYLDAASKPSRHENDMKAFLDQVRRERLPIWSIAENLFAKISFGERNEGIVALAESPNRTLAALERHLPKKPLVAVLERIEKPGNIGSVFRSADGAGIDAVLLADCGADLFHPNTIRASLGTCFSIPSVSLSSGEILDWLAAKHFLVAAARCDQSEPYTDFDFSGSTAIALGSESDGLSSAWAAAANPPGMIRGVKIPMLGVADSLNISAAATVLFYEARRHRM